MTIKSIRPKQPPRLADGNTVSVIMARTVKKGCELRFWNIETEIEIAMRKVKGFLAINHLSTMSEGNNEFITIVQFDSVENLTDWENSTLRSHLLGQLDELIEGDIRRKSVVGLEGMFDSPSAASTGQLKPPPKHKMAILVIAVIYVMLLILRPLINSVTTFLPAWAQLFFVVVTQVIIMTYVVMPSLTRWLSNWLFTK